MPSGALGVVRVLAFVAVSVGAFLLARPPETSAIAKPAATLPAT